jgi:hypothetical protein
MGKTEYTSYSKGIFPVLQNFTNVSSSMHYAGQISWKQKKKAVKICPG